MCKACDSLVTGVPDVRPHVSLRGIGTPSRSSACAWVIHFRCQDCRALWYYLLDPGNGAAGFQRVN